MVLSEKNENMIKLKELSDKICANEAIKDEENNENDYKVVVEEIQTALQDEAPKIDAAHDEDKKLKCYESLYSTIKIILNKFKIA